eukprot:Pgem_evm1s1469
MIPSQSTISNWLTDGEIDIMLGAICDSTNHTAFIPCGYKSMVYNTFLKSNALKSGEFLDIWGIRGNEQLLTTTNTNVIRNAYLHLFLRTSEPLKQILFPILINARNVNGDHWVIALIDLNYKNNVQDPRIIVTYHDGTFEPPLGNNDILRIPYTRQLFGQNNENFLTCTYINCEDELEKDIDDIYLVKLRKRIINSYKKQIDNTQLTSISSQGAINRHRREGISNLRNLPKCHDFISL